MACSPPEPPPAARRQPVVQVPPARGDHRGHRPQLRDAQIPQNDVQWVVSLDIGGAGKDDFSEISRELVCPGGGTQCDQFAIVLDGQVHLRPDMEGVITDGQAQISGNFTETSANSLATSLKFGALPIAFEDDATSETDRPLARR